MRWLERWLPKLPSSVEEPLTAADLSALPALPEREQGRNYSYHCYVAEIDDNGFVRLHKGAVRYDFDLGIWTGINFTPTHWRYAVDHPVPPGAVRSQS